MVRHSAYELSVVAAGGDQLAAQQVLASKNLAVSDLAKFAQMLYEPAHWG